MNPQSNDDFTRRLTEIGIAICGAVIVVGIALFFTLREKETDSPIAAVGIEGVTNFDDVTLDDDLTVGDDATITGDLAVTGATDLASTLQFGTDNLYPLGYASTGYQIVCGTSGTFTETTAVSVSGLTTITHAIVTQITDPASTGALITVDAPTTSTLTINSWETDATVGTTGVNAYYCAVGNQ